MFDLHLPAGSSELTGAVAGDIVGEQCADADAVAVEELHRRAAGGAGLNKLT
jgi:hypothetical protein